MDHTSSRDKGPEVDIESGQVVFDEDLNNKPVSGSKRQGKTLMGKFCDSFADGLPKPDGRQSSGEVYNTNGFVSPENIKVVTCKMLEAKESVDHAEKTSRKEKRKKTSNKKPPKPPRPPRGPSLDAADQKLIREISELAVLKRARVERIKAWKKMKAAKTSSSNSNMFAMVFTIIFFLVIIFQGNNSYFHLKSTFLLETYHPTNNIFVELCLTLVFANHILPQSV